MQNTTAFGRALNPLEKQHARFLDAQHAFRLSTCLRMEEGDDAAAQKAAAADAAAATKAAADKAAADAAAKAAADKAAADKGYPPNTPIKEMTDAQRAAYFEDKARVEENRRKELTTITGGLYGDDLKKLIDEHSQLKAASLTDGEKAIEEAKQQTRAEVTLETVRTAFDLVLPDDMPAEQKQSALEVLNLKAFLTPNGQVDTAKVRTHAATLAPAKGQQQQHQQRQWGAGHTDTGGAPLGAGGAAEANRRFGDQSKSTNS